MSWTAFDIIFLISAVITGALRFSYARLERRDEENTTHHDKSLMDRALIAVAFSSMVILPLLALFTPLLDFARYSPLPAIAWIGAPLTFLANFIFWRAHSDLGRNFSPKLKTLRQQSLVQNGIYAWIRHPMYAGMLIGGAAQLLLLHNYIAGPATLITAILFAVLRVPKEETMLINHFGDAYKEYQKQTGGLIPRKIPSSH